MIIFYDFHKGKILQLKRLLHRGALCVRTGVYVRICVYTYLHRDTSQ
jgi:hypothetical protein